MDAVAAGRQAIGNPWRLDGSKRGLSSTHAHIERMDQSLGRDLALGTRRGRVEPHARSALWPPTACDAERMPDVFDIYTIIFLALAVFIFLRLRSVLGQRTGRERPPYPTQDGLRRPIDTVVPMPQRPTEAAPRATGSSAGSTSRSLEGSGRTGFAGRRRARCHRGGGYEFRRQAFSSPARAPPTR